MRKAQIIQLVVILLWLTPVLLFGQDDDAPFPDDNPDCGPPFGPACIPIDGGLSFLIAAGVALGGKKAVDLYRNRE